VISHYEQIVPLKHFLYIHNKLKYRPLHAKIFDQNKLLFFSHKEVFPFFCNLMCDVLEVALEIHWNLPLGIFLCKNIFKL